MENQICHLAADLWGAHNEQDLRASIAASLSSARVRCCWASGWAVIVIWDVSLFSPLGSSSFSFTVAVVGPRGWMIWFNEDRLKRTRTKKKPSEKKTRCRVPSQDHRSPNGLHILASQWEPSAHWWKVNEGDQKHIRSWAKAHFAWIYILFKADNCKWALLSWSKEQTIHLMNQKFENRAILWVKSKQHQLDFLRECKQLKKLGSSSCFQQLFQSSPVAGCNYVQFLNCLFSAQFSARS